MEVKIGKKYRHFKGTIMEVIAIAKHSETLEELVIYKHLEDGQIWARPLTMFCEKVDTTKYPNATQVYRFEEID